MTAKQYLQQIRRLDIKINQKMQEKNELQISLQGGMSSVASGARIQGGKLLANKGFANAIDRIIVLETEIDSDIDRFVDLRHTIIGQIHDLENPAHGELLYKRYIERKRLITIANEMHYTYDWIRKMHSRALREFERRHIKAHKSTFYLL